MVRLGVQDLDFEYNQITVRAGKGDKDRVKTFSETLMPLPRHRLDKVNLIPSRQRLEFRVSAMRKGNG
ncbi:hypothetical protein [Methylotuvimicrobium sp.]|uniref:hypothetical protein n=1 Tax=Methylotuvimicrobium sp. TaxID=2822413 RepID=UPI003D658106